jgi:hypothetical protein
MLAHPRRTAKQVRILLILLIVLLLVVFNPVIRVGTDALFTGESIRLPSAELARPKGWKLSHSFARVWVVKPCITIFCTSPRASFVLEPSGLPDQVWTNAAEKVLRENYGRNAGTRTFTDQSGRLKCVELDSPMPNDDVVASCLNSDLHFTSTFFGKRPLESVFYQVLATARRVD